MGANGPRGIRPFFVLNYLERTKRKMASGWGFTNEMTKLEQRPRSLIEPFVLVLSPFAPHLAEELWALLGHQPSVSQQPWPAFDPALTVSDRLTVPIQINGKLRGKIEVGADVGRQEVEALARQEASEWLQGKELKKIIYVEKKLINFVV